MILKKFVGTGLLVAVLFATGCDSGVLTTFRAGFAALRPFIQSLVDSNTIPQTTANLAIADIEDSIDALTKGDQCLNAITVVGNAKKVEKAKCYFAAAKDLRSILDRHHFEGNELLNRVSTIAEGAISALEEYYRSVTTTSAAPAGMRGGSSDAADKILEQKMNDAKQKMKDLKRELEKK